MPCETGVYQMKRMPTPQKRSNKLGSLSVDVKVNVDRTEFDDLITTLKWCEGLAKSLRNLGFTKRQTRKLVKIKMEVGTTRAGGHQPTDV